jgi:nucleoid DNA-binding protein
MKIAQHFRAFLERHHYLQLPQIGRFEVVGENPVGSENGHSQKWINFSEDKNQATDSDLVAFISNNMKVESCITASDLSSFIGSIKELLIQGFEVEIPGIGYLHFEQGNILKFSGKNIYKKTTQKSWKRIPASMSSSFWF